MMMNTFTNKLPLCFPSVMLTDSPSIPDFSVTSVPYRKYAFRSAGAAGAEKDLPIRYTADARNFVNDAFYGLTRRVVLVTDSIYQAARVAFTIKYIPKLRFYKEYGYCFGTVAKEQHPFETPDYLPVFDFNEAQRYEKNCEDDVLMASFPQYCDQIFVGMGDYSGNADKMLSILNNSGARLQFLVVSKEDLGSEWFDVLQRDNDMYIIHINEPDDSYYVELIHHLFKQTARYELVGITPERIVYLARKKYGLGKNRNLSEEDLAWFFDKAAINVMIEEHNMLMNHIELTEEDFTKLLPEN